MSSFLLEQNHQSFALYFLILLCSQKAREKKRICASNQICHTVSALCSRLIISLLPFLTALIICLYANWFDAHTGNKKRLSLYLVGLRFVGESESIKSINFAYMHIRGVMRNNMHTIRGVTQNKPADRISGARMTTMNYSAIINSLSKKMPRSNVFPNKIISKASYLIDSHSIYATL